MGNEASKSAENGDNFEFEPDQSVEYSGINHRWRQISGSIAVILAVALTLVLAAHSSQGSPPRSAPTSHTHPTAQATTAALPTTPPVASPFLTRSDSLLEPIPAKCPTPNTSVPVTQIVYYADPAFGLSPVWVVGLSDEQNQRVVNFGTYPPLPYTSHGWRWRILLVASPRYDGTVMLSGSGTDSALFMDVGSGPIAKLVLNAGRPTMRGVGWAEWPVYVYLPEPGCYKLDANWPGGSWTINFAAGF